MDLFTKIKAMNSFTGSEQRFIDFIFNHPYDVIQLNLQQLSCFYFYYLSCNGKTRN